MRFYHTARNDIIHLSKRRAKKPAFYITLLNSNLTNLSCTVTSLNTDVTNIKPVTDRTSAFVPDETDYDNIRLGVYILTTVTPVLINLGPVSSPLNAATA